MKKLFSLFVFLFFVFIQSMGQISYRIEAGISLVDMVWVNLPESSPKDNSERYDTRFSHLSGLSVQLDLKSIYFKSGLMYHNRGSIENIKYLTQGNQLLEERLPLHLHYLGIPILIGRRIINKLSLEAGPEFNYLIAKDNYPDFDLGLQAGLVYELFDKFSTKINYYHGFTNELSKVIDGPPSLQNRMFALSLGYKL